jgi:hypothetical protein
LLIKKQLLLDRFRRSILRQSYRPADVSESLMLNKMFIADETSAIKFDKEVVAQGIPLDLPPPPPSWQQEIAARISDEVSEMSRKRKLPFLDEDLSEHLSEVKKQPVDESLLERESEDGTEDEDDDNDDSDDDDDEDANPGDDMSEYLGPNDNGHVDINSIYDDLNCDPSLTSSDNYCDRSDTMTPFGVQSSSQSDWQMGYERNHWPPSARFPEREAAEAVESILTSDEEEEEDDDDESGLPPHERGNGEEEDEDEEDEDDDDDEEEDEDGEDEEDGSHSVMTGHAYAEFSSEPNMQEQAAVDPCDPQMQCAIDSILVDLPQQATHQPYFQPDSYGRPYGSMSGSHRPGLTSFGHSLQMNDPALDEAVKSILS